jgi:OmpA-OmpF porin, OOP family
MNQARPNSIILALSLAGTVVLSACVNTPRDVPPKPPQTGNDVLDRYGRDQAALDALASADPATKKTYDWARAQCFVQHAYSERHENDRSGFSALALTQAEGIIKALQAKQNGPATQPINHPQRMRPDLWLSAENYRNNACAAATAGCIEVQLVRSGHEYTTMGWRHANSYFAIAQDMVDGADAAAKACNPVVSPPPTPLPSPKPMAVPATAATLEKISLSASALFKFNKRSSADLLPIGKRELDELAKKINTGYASVDGITLVGYTDRLGSLSYNAKLSLDRANTVKTYLQNQGVKAPITTQGKGPADPVANCPGRKPSPKLTTCLQPNRRVEVLIQGVKR